MSDFYTSLQATAAKLIASKGQLVTVRGLTPGTYDQATLTQSETPVVVFSGNAVTLDFPAKEIDGELVKRGDTKVLLPVTSSTMAEIKLGYTITIGGVLHRISMVKPIRPGGTIVLYILGARSGA